MPTLFDLLNAQNGAAMQALAQQFNLSQQQTQAALEALLPAFSQGLKRNATDPYGIGAFLSALCTGQHAKYFDNPTTAFSPQGTAEGNGILGHLFGSKELSRAVAAQAAQATGIGQQVLQQMLPAIAAILMGGMFRQSAQPVQSSGLGANPLQQVFEQMIRQGGGFGLPQTAPQQDPADPFDNPFAKALRDMFGGGATQHSEPRQAPSGFGDNPWGKMFEEMMRGGRAETSEPAPAPAQKKRCNPSGRERTPYDDLFGDMFEAGAKQRDDYQKNMESIFDQFVKGMDRHR
ncbi:MAG TPA: DUF937 domain-containing protein [Rhizobiales bacterium]|nr:DUF937 domain-containing protein [Hyphomicrobiales bacterium]